MKQTKNFRKPKILSRLENTRNLRRFLIVCEGEKTEPNYFRKFPENPEVYDRIDVHGTGYNTISLVNEAIKLKIEAFEIWYMLHFNFYDSALSRNQYKEKLSELLGRPYKKNDEDMYQLL